MSLNVTTASRRESAIKLLSKGYTTRAVNLRLQDAGLQPYPEHELVKIRMQYAGHLQDIRERDEIEVRAHGLARPTERVKRLVSLAEELETKVEGMFKRSDIGGLGAVPATLSDGQVRTIQLYQKTLAQIGEEAKEMGIVESGGVEDPWIELFKQLISLATDRQSHNNITSSTLSESHSLEDQTGNNGHLKVVPERNLLLEESEEERASTLPQS